MLEQKKNERQAKASKLSMIVHEELTHHATASLYIQRFFFITIIIIGMF